jgi:hypothetical protein
MKARRNGDRHAHDSIPRVKMNFAESSTASTYGFTAEELDFIINYDIKYRRGRDAGDEEE